jgi:SAM-dependent methyltransferase
MNLRAPFALPTIELVNREDWILSRVRSGRVLHAGPTDNFYTQARAASETLLHQKLMKAGVDVVGVDIDLAGISTLRSHGIDNILHGDVERLEELFSAGTMDTVLAADVLEHLNNPGHFLRGARHVLSPSGKLVITVPNAFSFKKFVGVALFRQERNHPDHVAYYSLMNLYQLLNRFGFEITEVRAFLIIDPNPRFVNRLANVVAKGLMALLGNRAIADEWAIVAQVN